MFTYEYTFRLSNDQKEVSQIYPYIDDQTVSILVKNFDWDNDGFIRIVSVAKNGTLCPVSGENSLLEKEFPIVEAEKNTTIEIQFVKNQSMEIKNNNVVVSVQNQYGDAIAFYTLPIGGRPVYNPKLKMTPLKR